MKKKIILFGLVIISVFIVQFTIRHYRQLKQLKIYRFPERFNLVKNNLVFELDTTLLDNDIRCYWVGYLNNPGKMDTIPIYENGVIGEIPDSYGKNYIVLKYNDLIYDKIGILKLRGWYKYNYHFNLKEVDSLLIIDWCISNKYESTERIDTVLIRNQIK